MGRRSYDFSSNDLDRQDRKKCSSISNSRIAIIVPIVLLAWAAIAGIIVAVYFTSIPAPQNKSDGITRAEVTKVKAFQGEVRIEQDWNEILKDRSSALSKEKAYNFTSAEFKPISHVTVSLALESHAGGGIVPVATLAVNDVDVKVLMDAVCRNSSDYNGTVVDGFRNGSIIVSYRIFWLVRIIQEIDSSAKLTEVETNPVDTAKLIKLITEGLPKQLRANVTYTSELQDVTSTTASPTTASVTALTNTTTRTTKESATTAVTASNTHWPTSNTTLKPTTTTTPASKEPTIITTNTSTITTSTTQGPMTTSNSCQVYVVTLACQFENNCLCGYRNLRNDTTWYQRSGHFFKLPRNDHTYGNDTGQFMVAYNTSDMGTYYNILSRSGLGYPYRLEYSYSTLSSPRENFMNESCVYFYYYLNGTALRPSPLSAQLFVYVNGSSGRRLAWYDQINRTVSGWLKGLVPVQPGYAEVIFVAKTITTTTGWPGIVALDDVSAIHQPCTANPDCGPDTFQCNTTRVCIPVYMQCDGGNDCIDGSDEEDCIGKPDYQVKLINGDGSYGSIAIFYHGLWRPVCMSKYNLTEGSNSIVQLACKKVGYTGRYQGAFVNSWHQPVEYAMQVSCRFDNVDISNCSMYLTQTTENTSSCYYYQAAFCSKDECFSGEKLCPPDYTYSDNSSSTKCISQQYFCDGIPDCPGYTDELNCANCSTSEFECSNHDCLPASHRCDGTPQCGDKSDEYGCVIVANNMSKIYHSHLSAYLPVCYNNMNDTLANMLCSLSGQRSSRYYQQYMYVQDGTMLTPQSKSTTYSLVPGYAVSIEPCYSVLLQCASFECGTTMFDDSRLSKILFGRDAVLGQLPWQIGLYANGNAGCSCSIIHPHWVITAAHCTVHMETYSVRVGAVEVGMYNSEGYQGQLYNSSRTYNNPLFNRDYDNDISLLYIDQPIVFSNYVRPICVASSGTVEEMLKAGYNTECYVSGWGHRQNFINREVWLGKLKMIRVYLYSTEECNHIYYDTYKSYPQNTTVCVDNQNLGSPNCHGDSGGPLICRNKYGRFELLGTLSWGYNSCFKDGYPDIFQLSYPHADWIERTTGLNFSDLTMDMD